MKQSWIAVEPGMVNSVADPMHTEFKKAKTSKEIRSLMAFDRKVFRDSDRFPAEYWKHIDVFWMLIDNVKVGCCGFERNVDFQGDLREDGINPRRDGSLYLATTGILPRFQGLGLGELLKCWEISYARHHRFHRIVTNTRERNVIMIELNKKFGFQVIRTAPRYYSSPMDSTVVMELLLTPPQSRVGAAARSAASARTKEGRTKSPVSVVRPLKQESRKKDSLPLVDRS